MFLLLNLELSLAFMQDKNHAFPPAGIYYPFPSVSVFVIFSPYVIIAPFNIPGSHLISLQVFFLCQMSCFLALASMFYICMG